MAASLLSEARGVAHILEGQLLLLKPLVAVHGTQRLLTGCYQVLVLSLTYKLTSLSWLLQHSTSACLVYACSTRPALCNLQDKVSVPRSSSCSVQVDIQEVGPISRSNAVTHCHATKLAASQAMLEYRSGQPWQHRCLLKGTTTLCCQSRS